MTLEPLVVLVIVFGGLSPNGNRIFDGDNLAYVDDIRTFYYEEPRILPRDIVPRKHLKEIALCALQ